MSLIRYAGWEPPNKFQRKIPVDRAVVLRSRGMNWKQIARILTDECDREVPFTDDAVQQAVGRLKKKRQQRDVLDV